MRTWLTERFDLAAPVVQAPMAGLASGRLAAAVSAAGALGTVGVGSTATPDWVRQQCAVAAAPSRPYGVALMAWALPSRPELLEAVLEARPALVSVSHGDFRPYVAALRDVGIVVAVQAGTRAEALEAESAGADVVVARGGEGGGHGRDEVATLPLLQAVLDAVHVPVLAAGGIATARGLAAVLAAGAAGGWLGTAFLACREADTTGRAKARLLAADETSTSYGRVFDVALGLGWPPEFGARGLRNRFFDAWVGREEELADDDAAARQLETARTEGDYDTAFLYAGQGVGLLQTERSAAEVIADLAAAADLLRAAVGEEVTGRGREQAVRPADGRMSE